MKAGVEPTPHIQPLSGEPDWAGVAREMAFENASLTRFFLSWLSAYLWAAEGDKRAVADFLTAAVMGDGSIQTAVRREESGVELAGDVRLTVGRFSAKRKKKEEAGAITHIHKAALALAVLKAAGHEPERVYARARGESRWFELEWRIDAARGFLSNASLWLYAPELAGGNDEIRVKYSRALEAVGVEAHIKDFTAEGKRPRARLVVRLGGDTAEFSIRLQKGNMVELRFGTTSREEAERRAAVLRAVGVGADVKRTYHKSRNRDQWYIVVSTNVLAAESVHEEVRKAVVEFLQRCREAGALEEKTCRRLAAKIERGVPEWGDIRFSLWLKKTAPW
ncbi:PaRep2b protein [Pyrobaculum ferrireducens]|uniref:PaRep2b domain-containing protein n=1 Tax=Pyrobaculum ferrireducens TaxID=1104324 RepID=G7VCZ5_9CREN|nr:PaRep2b protein [Pyrobaculum ferrireducens]AET32684.1 hypothetical protein P186_1255 [Pyrobaculum ferrireducens]